MNQKIPEQPRFVWRITALQKILAGISVSMFLVLLLTTFHFITDIFQPDFTLALQLFRVVIALLMLSCLSVVGYQQIGRIVSALIEFWDYYKKLTDLKKKQEEEK